MLGIPASNITYRTVYYVNAEEQLAGQVMGQKASDIEERAAKYHIEKQIQFGFRVRVNPLVEGGLTTRHLNMLGEVEIDILSTFEGVLYPIMIQGEIAHFYAESQKTIDQYKIDKINNFLKEYKAHPVITIPFWLLRNQEETNHLFQTGYANGFSAKYYQ